MDWAELVYANNSEQDIRDLYNAANVVTRDQLTGGEDKIRLSGQMPDRHAVGGRKQGLCSAIPAMWHKFRSISSRVPRGRVGSVPGRPKDVEFRPLGGHGS